MTYQIKIKHDFVPTPNKIIDLRIKTSDKMLATLNMMGKAGLGPLGYYFQLRVLGLCYEIAFSFTRFPLDGTRS